MADLPAAAPCWLEGHQRAFRRGRRRAEDMACRVSLARGQLRLDRPDPAGYGHVDLGPDLSWQSRGHRVRRGSDMAEAQLGRDRPAQPRIEGLRLEWARHGSERNGALRSAGAVRGGSATGTCELTRPVSPARSDQSCAARSVLRGECGLCPVEPRAAVGCEGLPALPKTHAVLEPDLAVLELSDDRDQLVAGLLIGQVLDVREVGCLRERSCLRKLSPGVLGCHTDTLRPLADGSDAEVAPSDPDPQKLVRVDVC